jgi:cytochrome P450
VPAEDRPSFQPLVRASTAGLEAFADDAAIVAALAAREEMHSYFVELLAERRRHPADDLLSGLAEAREHDDALTDDEVISTSILLFAAGFETTTNLIGKSGQVIMVLQGAANRDPERFPEPDRLDLGRPGNVPLSFGWGAHHCLGATLARLEGEIVFGGLLDRFAEIELATGDIPRRPSLTLRGVTSLPVRLR